MQLRINEIISDSIVDGPGLRMTVFVQGCPHRCEGCHNPQTHDFSGGRDIDTDEIVEKYKKNPLLDGVTLSGGEPFCQAVALLDLAKKIKSSGGNIFAYSGFTYEQLIENCTEGSKELLEVCDYLVDGKFILAQRDLTLNFRGSTNQRIINCNKTRETGEIVIEDL